MSGPQLDGPALGSMDIAPEEETREEAPVGDMEAFRKTLIRQSRYFEAPSASSGVRSWKVFLELGVERAFEPEGTACAA